MTQIDIDRYTIQYPEESIVPDTPEADRARLFLDDSPQIQVLYPDGVKVPGKDVTGRMTDGVAKTVLGSPTAILNLSGWSQNSQYSQLHLNLVFRTDGATTYIAIRPNNDTTTGNYVGWSWYNWSSNLPGGGINQGATANGILGGFAGFWLGSGLTIELWQNIHVCFDFYNQSSEVKIWTSMGAGWFNNNAAWNYYAGGYWKDTANAITSLYITPGAGNFVAGSFYRIWVQ